MTREEAINKLVNARYADEFQGDEELTTALLMAIEALEQEPDKDDFYTRKNEEATKQLKKLKSFHNGSYGEALAIAIKAIYKQIQTNEEVE